MGKFIVRNGDLEGRKFRLEAGANITLGRERADINFFDKRMSRRHCSLEVREGVDYVTDLGSTNGTWVNNQRVKEAELLPGDLVRVGFTELEFLGNPEPTMPMMRGAGALGPVNPNQTIAFRAKDILRPPPAGRRKRFQGKSRLQAAKHAAMGKRTGDRQYISAKGKFCEACGEAIFVKEGAQDEGSMVDGLYLCRMCALISEKQKQLGQDDLLPSYAKIVGGRMGAPPGAAPPAVPASDVPLDIVEEEVSLEDLIGPGEGEDTVRADEEAGRPSGAPEGVPGASSEAPVGDAGERLDPAEALAFLDEMLKSASPGAAAPRLDEAPSPGAEAHAEQPEERPAERAAEEPAAEPAAEAAGAGDDEAAPPAPAVPPVTGGAPPVGEAPAGEPEEQPAVQAENRPAEKPAEEPEEKPAAQAEEKPVEEPEERPAAQAEDRPAEKPEEKPAAQAEEEPAERFEEKPAVQAEDRPAEKPEEKPAAQVEEKPVEEPEERAAAQAEDKPAAGLEEKPADGPPAEKLVEKPGAEAGGPGDDEAVPPQAEPPATGARPEDATTPPRERKPSVRSITASFDVMKHTGPAPAATGKGPAPAPGGPGPEGGGEAPDAGGAPRVVPLRLPDEIRFEDEPPGAGPPSAAPEDSAADVRGEPGDRPDVGAGCQDRVAGDEAEGRAKGPAEKPRKKRRRTRADKPEDERGNERKDERKDEREDERKDERAENSEDNGVGRA